MSCFKLQRNIDVKYNKHITLKTVMCFNFINAGSIGSCENQLCVSNFTHFRKKYITLYFIVVLSFLKNLLFDFFFKIIDPCPPPTEIQYSVSFNFICIGGKFVRLFFIYNPTSLKIWKLNIIFKHKTTNVILTSGPARPAERSAILHWYIV